MIEHTTALAKRSEPQAGEVLVMPASAEKVDRALVDRAMAHLREVVTKTVARGLDDVGT